MEYVRGYLDGLQVARTVLSMAVIYPEKFEEFKAVLDKAERDMLATIEGKFEEMQIMMEDCDK